MDEEIERLVVSVRADTAAFAGDVGAMRRELEDGLGGAGDRAGRLLEGALARAVRTGKFEFQDLGKLVQSVMAEIAASSVRSALGGLGGGGGLAGIATGLIGSLLGLPGRATGGPVTAGRGYLVGERGPELFVPAGAGRIEPQPGRRAGGDVRLTINVHAPQSGAPEALARSGRQVARAVRAALQAADR